MKKLTIALAVMSASILIAVCPASADLITPIDLNDFFFFPGDPVTVAVDGSEATIAEDPSFSPITLSNDPVAGDPEVIIAGPGTQLLFDFDFNEPAGNDDEFGAFLFNAVTGLEFGSPFQFFIQDTGSGNVSFDLSTLIGYTLGLQFQLSALPGDLGLGSTVTVSNVRLVTPVPEPATILLLASGLFGILGLRRRKLRN